MYSVVTKILNNISVEKISTLKPKLFGLFLLCFTSFLLILILLSRPLEAFNQYPTVEEVTQQKYVEEASKSFFISLDESIFLQANLAGEIKSVGEIFAGQKIYVEPENLAQSNPNKSLSTTFRVDFGYAYAEIIMEKTLNERILNTFQSVNSLENELNKHVVAQIPKTKINQPRTNELFITSRLTTIYQAPQLNSPKFGQLYENLRYPINAIFIDDKKQVWFQIQIAGNFVYVKASDVEIDKGVPVLTFHHLLKDDENTKYRHTSTTTSDTAFAMQMGYLKQEGFRTITLSELYGFLNKSANLPAKVFVITFDDGLKSVYRYAYPILDALDFKATVFMITSRIKRHPQQWDPNTLQFMSVDEIDEAKGVFNYQSHSHFLHKLHEKKPIIFSRSKHVIEKDIERSRRALLQFNPQVDFFAYPFGAYNEVSVQAVKNAGIKMAFSTVKGKVKPGDNLLKLKRIYLLSTDSLDMVAKKVENKSPKN